MVLIDPVTASQAPNDQKDASTASTSSSGNAGQQSDVFSAESTQSVGKTYSLERENDETTFNPTKAHADGEQYRKVGADDMVTQDFVEGRTTYYTDNNDTIMSVRKG